MAAPSKNDVPEGQAGRHIGKIQNASLSGFIARLGAMSNAEVAAADPRRAVKSYKIREDYAVGYIKMERQKRGLPPL